MKTLIPALILVLSLAAACRDDAEPAPPAAGAAACDPDRPDDQVVGKEAGIWEVQSRVCLNGRQSRAGAAVRAQFQPVEGPVFGLARARAWGTLARELSRSGRPDEALAAVRRALHEIGDHYARPEDAKDDDTRDKLLEADTLLRDGRKTDALHRLLEALNARIEMLQALHGLK